MPINFQPAAPMSPAAFAAYGQAAANDPTRLAQLYRQGTDSIVRPMELAAQIASNRTAGDADRAARVQTANDDRFAQQSDVRARIGGDLYGQQVQNNYNAVQNDIHFQQQAALQQQHAELDNWLNSRQISQAEQLRLTKLQNALGVIQADPNLTADEKQSFTLQLRTGIDPLQARADATRQKLVDEQVKQALVQSKAMAAAEGIRQSAIAGNWSQVPQIFDDVTGQSFRVVPDVHGSFDKGISDARATYLKIQDDKAVERKAQVAELKKRLEDAKPLPDHEMVVKAKAEAEARAAIAYPDALRAGVKKVVDKATQQESEQPNDPEYYAAKLTHAQDVYREVMGAHGMKKAAYESLLRQMTGVPDPQAQQPPPPQGAVKPQSAPQPTQSSPAQQRRPQMPPEIQQVQAAKARVVNDDSIPPGAKMKAVAVADEIGRLAADTDGFRDTTPESRKKIADLMTQFNRAASARVKSDRSHKERLTDHVLTAYNQGGFLSRGFKGPMLIDEAAKLAGGMIRSNQYPPWVPAELRE